MNRKVLTKIGAVLLFIAFGVVGASAGTLQLKIIDLGNPASEVIIIDGEAGDIAISTEGKISYNGSVGTWDVVISTAWSKPKLPNDDYTVHMDLYSLNSSGTSGVGELAILISDTDFAASATQWNTAVGGTSYLTAGTIDVNTYYADSNLVFDTSGVQIAAISIPLSGNFSDNEDYTGQSPTAPYAITIETVLNHQTEGYTIFDVQLNGITPVPEPSVLLLLGVGIAGVEILRRKF